MNNETKIKIGKSVGLTFVGNDNAIEEPVFVGRQNQFDEYFAALKLSECCDASIVEQTGRCSKCGENV